MNKKTLIIWIGILAAVFAVGILAASLVVEYIYPQSATVQAITFAVYVDTVPWANNTNIPWGNVVPDATYTKNLTVVNNGTVPVTVYLFVSGLPAGWTETWAANGALLAPSEVAYADLTLNVPVGASLGAEAWSSKVRGEET